MPTQNNSLFWTLHALVCGWFFGSVKLWLTNNSGSSKQRSMNFWRLKNFKIFQLNSDKVSLKLVYSAFQDIPTFSVRFQFGGQFICSVSAVLDGTIHLLERYFLIYCSSVQRHLQKWFHFKNIDHTQNIRNKFQDLFHLWLFLRSNRNKNKNDILLVHIYILRLILWFLNWSKLTTRIIWQVTCQKYWKWR